MEKPLPGMSPGPTATDPRVVAAFHDALAWRGLAAAVVLAAVLLVWWRLKSLQLRAAAAGQLPERHQLLSEAPGRKAIRVAFGLLFVFDGFLQTQPAMPEGLVPRVIKPTADLSARFVQVVVAGGTSPWRHHPVTAAAAVVFIQVGIGLMLLVAPRGLWSRLAGGAALFWALLVWTVGESFGGLFAPGGSVLFGLPGAALFYVLAGGLVALPERHFSDGRLGRLLLRLLGCFLLGMALLQAWPGRGFWRSGAGNPVSEMARQMARVAQPAVFTSVVRSFSGFSASHGFDVNLAVVVLLALIGSLLLLRGDLALRLGLGLLVLFALATWLLVQDLGFFGGLGTDPNSMVPLIVIALCAYVARCRPSPAEAESPVRSGEALSTRLRQAAIERPTFLLRSTAAAAALGVVLIGAIPMAAAAVGSALGPAAHRPAAAAEMTGRLARLPGATRSAAGGGR